MLRPGTLVADEGLAFWVALPAVFAARSSGVEGASSSDLILWEDSRALGPANALHADIRSAGGGRYSHWGTGLYFSTSDGSDPRGNGRVYRVALPEERSAQAAPAPDRVTGGVSPSTFPEAPRWTIEPTRIAPGAGHAWSTPAPPDWAAQASRSERPQHSRLVLFEDGRALAPANAAHARIREGGQGAYSHWNESLLFSTSDQSDPRANGRRYEALLSREVYARVHLAIRRPVVADEFELIETLAPPSWLLPAHDGELVQARPTLQAGHVRDDVLFQFELDTRPDFDSRNLLRWPRLAEGPQGPHPLVVLDPESDGGPRFRPSFRLSALALPDELGDDALRLQAHRLVFGLAPGREQVEEVLRYVAQQFYPFQDGAGRFEPDDVLALDGGTCGSLNGLLRSLLDSVGYDTRLVACEVPRLSAISGVPGSGGHTGLEVRADGGWHYADAYFDVLAWGAGLAGQPGRVGADETLFVYAPAGALAGEDETVRGVSLADFSMRVRYQHDLWAAAVAHDDYLDPEPPGSPDPALDRHALWPADRLRLFARVRVVRADRAQLRHLFPGRPAAEPRDGSPIEVSPWVTRSLFVALPDS